MNITKILLPLFLLISNLSIQGTTLNTKLCKLKKTFMSQREINKHFLVAVYKNNLDKVKHWIGCGADVNTINDYSSEELEKFSDEKHLHINIYMKDLSALMLARSVEMTEYLISQGADINSKSKLHLNSPKYSPRKKEMTTLLQVTNNAIKRGNPRSVIELLKAGVNFDEHFITYLKQQEQTRTTKAILDHIMSERREKIDQTLHQSCCRDVTQLIAEYLD